MRASEDAAVLARNTSIASVLFAGLLLGGLAALHGARSLSVEQQPTPRHAASAAQPTAAVTTATATSKRARLTPKEEQRPGVVLHRRAVRQRAQQAQRRIARAKSMGARGSVVLNPCLSPLGDACARGALDPFFDALDALEQGSAKKHASVAVLGNSLIAADHIVDVIRERLVARFGDGGRGFVLADRISDYGPRTRTGKASGFRPHNFSMGERGEYPFGVAGVLHVSKGRGARTVWQLFGEKRARLFLYEHERGPALRVLVDGVATGTYSTRGAPGERTLDIELPADARSLAIEAKGSGAVLYGALLERQRPGVLVNTFGVPAADASHFLSSDPDIFAHQLRAQDPALVVVMLGGNETKRLHWKRRTRDEVERGYAALLDRLQQVVPEAACLAVGPIDSVHGGPEKVWRTRRHLAWVIEMQKRVAAEKGCAYFDLFEAMGGPGSLRRFAAHGLLHEDMVHPKEGGLVLLGELLSDALLDAYEKAPALAPSSPPP